MTIFSFDLVVYFLLATIVISMIRVVIGPTIADRLVGLNLISAQVLAIFALLAVKEDLSVYLDVALVYDIFGFVGILAITKYTTHNKEKNNDLD
ncbi:monovalent cation/H+ antiporter complex subunit F [Chitinispirillales bacterium ANBcel5]|uniref:monovalent cation/H+ antiporter complex subunit F n=1 Tax=Cellulosispirillum alkaliphilum TaxID=3039283 RepID=UPI002A5464C2|nr:monovalent cation/H+ antiporter complex subunit F [Chitinispirillales bacterium ANBcel5]